MITVDGLSVGKALRDLNKWIREDIQEILHETLVAAMAYAQTIARAERRLGANNPHYVDSFVVEGRGTPKQTLKNTTEYADAVEFGGAPHRLSREGYRRLEAWAEVKGFEDPRAAAQAIGEKIAREGTPPFHILARTTLWFEREVRERIKKYTADINQESSRVKAIVRFRTKYGTSNGSRSASTRRSVSV